MGVNLLRGNSRGRILARVCFFFLLFRDKFCFVPTSHDIKDSANIIARALVRRAGNIDCNTLRGR